MWARAGVTKYGQQKHRETLNSDETAKLCDSDNVLSAKLQCKTSFSKVFIKNVLGQHQMAASARKSS